tara:strand:- start:52821 stop:53057 length:237 start_codon:yes stop_codon:yes gene_type:complete
MNIYSYQAYQAYQAINESIDDIIQSVDIDSTDAMQIQDLVNGQEEIFNRYDISDQEISNIKSGIEDSIRVKLGMFGES